MGVRIVSFFVLAMAAVLLGSCGEAPSLSLEDVEVVRFTALFSGTSRLASETEVERFVEYYSEAHNLADDFGTTPPARIDVALKSGGTLTIWGGGETYQTVGWGDRQYNIESEGLHQMLQDIASQP
ncbi:MAG: hypothetical protein ACYC33_13130 [Thermoleophilia bacterium]